MQKKVDKGTKRRIYFMGILLQNDKQEPTKPVSHETKLKKIRKVKLSEQKTLEPQTNQTYEKVNNFLNRYKDHIPSGFNILRRGNLPGIDFSNLTYIEPEMK
ncbi:hypothetical protein TVAG_155000 [Trichomonas vaginalis G3]|uniref:Uncharacterized protein n=1 Tax=Trichomonas vaginalis (strain ATCC PRA-98 / G3) TaxID=412133 RepID=A2FY05_TRIV3|nr:hypothetical protein TVAGG3_1025520 [Trichomonas vaginalis G3]EAX90204.1 hypothetical protein TVAG_155000 [Trichomonas vaginalis G3]KAI5492468.1 hypothetical protein TVAGG3_1025520 [Trichomonas vaginalis G3]|eukprot:XP_001303134.1 hypothetical protein [Trichomonas vaginalis G3]